jgi:hypothetical protein
MLFFFFLLTRVFGYLVSVLNLFELVSEELLLKLKYYLRYYLVLLLSTTFITFEAELNLCFDTSS